MDHDELIDTLHTNRVNHELCRGWERYQQGHRSVCVEDSDWFIFGYHLAWKADHIHEDDLLDEDTRKIVFG